MHSDLTLERNWSRQKQGAVSDASLGEKAVHYPAFDYLRLVLAATVAAFHGGVPIWSYAAILAVQVFFAMSGWLIGGILLRSTLEDLPRFYFNRATRIWIPYVAALLLLMAASLAKAEPITGDWLQYFFYCFTFVYDLFRDGQALYPLERTGNHMWSITAEEQFYLLAPLLITLLPAFGKKIWFWAGVTVLLNAIPAWTLFGSISLGVLAAVIRLHYGDWHQGNAARAVLGAICAVMLAGIYLEIIPHQGGSPLFSVLLVLFLAQPGSQSQLATFIGGTSYPLYLNHWIGAFMANAIFDRIATRGTLACNVTGVILSLLVAAALYAMIDRNVMKHRSTFFTRTRGKIAAITGYGLVALGIGGGLILMGLP